jgi:hypothetical protein
MNAGRSSRPRLAVLTVFALGLLLAYVVTLPPHLVHHLFDGDEHDQPRCQYFTQSQQTSEAPVDRPALLPPPAAPCADVAPAVADIVPTPDHSAKNPRAPPLV